MLSVIMLSVDRLNVVMLCRGVGATTLSIMSFIITIFSLTERNDNKKWKFSAYAECCYAQCRGALSTLKFGF
jgi:hypothetical protein